MSSLPLRGARTGNTYLRYHLACRETRPLIPAPTRRLPVNAGNASADTEGSRPVLPALCGPFAAPLFAPLSAPGTLCGCAMQLYFRFIGFMQYRLTPLNHKWVPLSSTIFHHRRAVSADNAFCGAQVVERPMGPLDRSLVLARHMWGCPASPE